MRPIIIFIPCKTVNALNTREHWAVRAKRARKQRETAAFMTRCYVSYIEAKRLAVKLTRYGVRDMDTDGLAASLKHIRDGIADALGIDDGDKRLHWVYEQDRCKRGDEGVKVEIRSI